ncbi:MAG: ATP synthase F0 subunit B [Deltaproteobacteria bacterium]|nr:ATP synthase F0 subunit B [Deltaproteobacteria bacterium]
MTRRAYAFWVPALALGVLLETVTSALGASGGGERPWTFGLTGILTWRIIDTLVLVALLYYIMRKPLKKFFVDRTDQIEKDLAEAKEQREQAQQTLKEYEAKLAGMEQELEKMRADLSKASELESEKVVANAQRMASSMVEAAKIAAEQEVRKGKAALQAEAVDLAVQMAETLIRQKITAEDQKRMVEEYLAKVGGMK